MILEQYNIKLKRLEISDIELVRNWRNAPHIIKWMEYQQPISEAQQLKWFKSIDNAENYYFLIYEIETPVGLIHSKNVDLKEGVGEGGIFIGSQKLKDELTPVFSSLCLLNAVFIEMDLFEKSIVKTNTNNAKVIQFNHFLGYTEIPGQTGDFKYYELTKERYIQATGNLRKTLEKQYREKANFKITGQPSDKNIKKINDFLIHQNNPDYTI